MKKLFKNFSWPMFFAYGIIFTLVAIPFEWLFGDFKEPNFNVNRYLLVLLFRGILFGLFMSLLFGKKVLEKAKKERS